LRGDRLALGCSIQEIGEGVKEVEFAGLERLKEKDPLRFGEEINAIRRYRPMTPSLPLNEIKDELRDLRSRDDDKAGWVLDSFFSDRQGDLDDKLGNPW